MLGYLQGILGIGVFMEGTEALGYLQRTLRPQGPDRRHWDTEFLAMSCVEVFHRYVSWPSS